MLANNIDEVIVALEQIIAQSKAAQSPMGYFAALYCKVTKKVKEGIAAGFFEDGPRMERLDVIFANRYLAAYDQYAQQQPTSACWQLAFDACKHKKLIILQHLLLGMNAHINLDLAIAAAQTSPGAAIDSLATDFYKINEILGSLVASVEEELAEIWPTLKYILRVAGKADDFLVKFSMELARNGAWKYAKVLATLDGEAQKEAILQRDLRVTEKAKIVTHPGWVAVLIFWVLRYNEKGSIADRIEILR